MKIKRLPILMVGLCLITSTSVAKEANKQPVKMMDGSVGSSDVVPAGTFGLAQAGTTWIGWLSGAYDPISNPHSIGQGGVWNFDDNGTRPCPVEDDFHEYIKNGAYAQGWTSEDVYGQSWSTWKTPLEFTGFVEGTASGGTTTLQLDAKIKGMPHEVVYIQWIVNEGTGWVVQDHTLIEMDANGNVKPEYQTWTISGYVPPAGAWDHIALMSAQYPEERVTSQGAVWKEGGSVVRTSHSFVPILSRSGMAILSILLLASAVFIIWRRREPPPLAEQ